MATNPGPIQQTNTISSKSSPALPIWIITVLIAGVVLVMHVRLYQYAFDDAYIHFRIARNFFETGSPYFNPNEIVKVSTSSGWTVFLTIIYAAAHLFKAENSFPFIISVLNAIISLAGMLIYTEILKISLKDRLPLCLILIFQISYLALLLPASIGLMETPFALLIAGAGILLLLKSNPGGFALLGLAVNVRLELVVLFITAALILLLRKQFRPLRVLNYSAAGLIPLLAYDIYFFHTVIPHSIISKSIIYSRGWFDSAIQILFYSLPDYGVKYNSILLGLGVITLSSGVIMLASSILAWKKSKIIWPALFCFWGLIVVGGYSLSKILLFAWYTPLYSIPLLAACVMLSARLARPRHFFIRGFLYIVFLLSIITLTRTVIAAGGNPNYFSQFEPGSRVKQYLRVGKILYEEYPNSTLLTSEIGGLGYAFEGRILDAAGLASPDALAFHPMQIPEQRSSGLLGAIPPEYVIVSRPDLIVSYDSFAQALLKDDIVSEYNVVQIPAYLPEDAGFSKNKLIWGSRYLRVFIRKGLPISENISALGE